MFKQFSVGTPVVTRLTVGNVHKGWSVFGCNYGFSKGYGKMMLSTALNGSGDLTRRRNLMLEKPHSATWKIHTNDVITFQDKAAFKV